jgi:hypothetical protein
MLDGLPVNCDISALQDLIASYGTVFDSEKKIRSQSSSVKFTGRPSIWITDFPSSFHLWQSMISNVPFIFEVLDIDL